MVKACQSIFHRSFQGARASGEHRPMMGIGVAVGEATLIVAGAGVAVGTSVAVGTPVAVGAAVGEGTGVTGTQAAIRKKRRQEMRQRARR
jgi:hypothetical protein